jgi:hypothetical protein
MHFMRTEKLFMPVADVTAGEVILAVTIFIAFGIVISLVLHQRRRTIWRQFARRHRLSYRASGEVVEVEGRVDNRPFALSVSRRSSDTGEFGFEEVTMKLGLHGVPPSLRLETGPSLPAQEEASTESLPGEAEDFEHLASMDCDDPIAAKDYLTPGRRARISELHRSSEIDHVRIAEGYLCLCSREAYSSLAQLELRLQKLTDAAAVLDANGT